MANRFAQAEAFQIFHEVQNVGKHVRKSKKRVTWKFSFEGENDEHAVVLLHTLTSGKKRIHMDGALIFTERKRRAGQFQHAFQLDGHLMAVQISGGYKALTDLGYNLVIDGRAFRNLRMTTTDARRRASAEIRPIEDFAPGPRTGVPVPADEYDEDAQFQRAVQESLAEAQKKPSPSQTKKFKKVRVRRKSSGVGGSGDDRARGEGAGGNWDPFSGTATDSDSSSSSSSSIASSPEPEPRAARTTSRAPPSPVAAGGAQADFDPFAENSGNTPQPSASTGAPAGGFDPFADDADEQEEDLGGGLESLRFDGASPPTPSPKPEGMMGFSDAEPPAASPAPESEEHYGKTGTWKAGKGLFDLRDITAKPGQAKIKDTDHKPSINELVARDPKKPAGSTGLTVAGDGSSMAMVPVGGAMVPASAGMYPGGGAMVPASSGMMHGSMGHPGMGGMGHPGMGGMGHPGMGHPGMGHPGMGGGYMGGMPPSSMGMGGGYGMGGGPMAGYGPGPGGMGGGQMVAQSSATASPAKQGGLAGLGASSGSPAQGNSGGFDPFN